ncbi:hypothetical protein QQS21_010220 [Conoideocrella luteorostrata]|uniref:Uncharacterized protein n=1 Tax=Conoideocrella luteorostrata TaxID=1105319 RepID=A0AAJ0CI62_9HYPO|nr:hypothetical protein QQS21_010220 [Conoideocrella luteorostrata]
MKLGSMYPTGEPMVEAVCRTLIGNHTMLGELAPPEFGVQYQNMKKYETSLVVKACSLLVIGFVIAFPLLIITIRYLPILAHLGILTALTGMQYIRVAPAVVFLAILPVFRCIYVLALHSNPLALAWYSITKLYPMTALNVVSKTGASLPANTASLPADCAPYASTTGLTGNKYALCLTETRLIGLMPLLTQEGDIVAILHGCDVPFVVRPTTEQGYYRLVGEAYVPEIMNGKLMGNADENYVDIVPM